MAAGTTGGDQQFTFTYYYGNGDTYSGYGIAAAGTYAINQQLTGFSNEVGNTGYYIIDSVIDLGYESGNNGYVYVDTYYDGSSVDVYLSTQAGQLIGEPHNTMAPTDLDGHGVGGYGISDNVMAQGYNGLGSESGYAYDALFTETDDNFFSPEQSADLIIGNKTNAYFTYYYGNGDTYSGMTEAPYRLYGTGDVITGIQNETGFTGYYVIDYAYDINSTNNPDQHNTVVYSYTDTATDNDWIGIGGFGTTENISTGIYGASVGKLGSELGYVYNNDYDPNGGTSGLQPADTGDNFYSPYHSADLYSI